MADVARHTPRPDIDILSDVNSVIAQYPPTAADRHSFTTTVQDGLVTLHGHVRTPISRRYLINELPKLDGVRALDSDALFDDESIRLDVGRLLPDGAMANVLQGTVALAGALPHGDDLVALADVLARVPGVVRVVANS